MGRCRARGSASRNIAAPRQGIPGGLVGEPAARPLDMAPHLGFGGRREDESRDEVVTVAGPSETLSRAAVETVGDHAGQTARTGCAREDAAANGDEKLPGHQQGDLPQWGHPYGAPG